MSNEYNLNLGLRVIGYLNQCGYSVNICHRKYLTKFWPPGKFKIIKHPLLYLR